MGRIFQDAERMTMDETQHGHLLLADISGYTSYVASTELTHSQEILTELLELIIERFKPLMTISKIEGDAIFAYAPEIKLPQIGRASCRERVLS